MHRRLFGISVLAAVFDSLLPDDKGKRLVVDYESKNPDLYRSIVIVRAGDLHGLGVGDLVGDDAKIVWDVKRAWVLPDGRLEVERYALRMSTNPKWPNMAFRTVDERGNPQTFTDILGRWRVRTVDQMGNTVRECSSTD